MVGLPFRLAAAVAFSLLVSACASTPDTTVGDYQTPPPADTTVVGEAAPQQCVPYVRARTGINIFGNASTWWAKAAGQYARTNLPVPGAVMVLTGYARGHAHLAYVSQVVSLREIRVDHANWLNDGQVFLDDPVVDVSPDNDWSEVRVFNERTGSWGARIYDVQGFIGHGPDQGTWRVAGS